MKKLYEAPEMVVGTLDEKDIVTLSEPSGKENFGSYDSFA